VGGDDQERRRQRRVVTAIHYVWKISLATFFTGLIVDWLLAAMEHWRVPRSSSNLPGRDSSV
jgi:hypothetical protein